jgi:hypothetical protein
MLLALCRRIWRPRRDSNPRYRRESVTASRIYNNLGDTGGTVSHWKSIEGKSFVYHFVYHDIILRDLPGTGKWRAAGATDRHNFPDCDIGTASQLRSAFQRTNPARPGSDTTVNQVDERL